MEKFGYPYLKDDGTKGFLPISFALSEENNIHMLLKKRAHVAQLVERKIRNFVVGDSTSSMG